ncbi:PEP-CTERM sorting domain-containing protein [Roseateles sp. BYS180W]|uniref:PEP-CTERM sorting domain-containing protein n=1 Tax=Roseateles rivi TaxID=3299028 RepID=A0ABW7FWS5_9BURK
MKSPFVKHLLASVAALAALSAQAGVVYQTGTSDPWGQTTNDQALNAAFGTGAWTKNQGYNLAAFTGAGFVFLEGGDGSAGDLNNFLSANRAFIENYVYNGGRLFINAAPNVGGNIDLGFGGVALQYPSYSSDASITAAGLAAGLGYGLGTTTFTGSYFSHATVSGTDLSSFVDGSNGSVFAVKSWGQGLVAFGGQTTTNWHAPEGDAFQLRVNQFSYLATAPVPEPSSYALMLAGVAGIAALARRRQTA